MPGPIGNVNSVKHGQRSVRANRHGLVHAKIGRRFASAYGHANSLRKAMERLVVQKCGEVSLTQQGRIQTICRLEEGCRALELAMRDSPKMSVEEIRATRHSIAQWTRERDNAMAELLGTPIVGGGGIDPWATLDNAQQRAQAPGVAQVPEAPSDATAGPSGDNDVNHENEADPQDKEPRHGS